jgi:hypothetical protein
MMHAYESYYVLPRRQKGFTLMKKYEMKLQPKKKKRLIIKKKKKKRDS